MNRIYVDVRENDEYKRAHVENAINIPPSDILAGAPQLKDVAKDTEIVLYCVSGSRSNVATNLLQSHGFTHLVNGVNAQQVSAKYGLKIITEH